MPLLHEKKRKKRRYYRKNYVTLIIIMLLFTTLTLYFLLFTDFFNIKDIAVEGNNMVAKDEILVKCGIKNSDNIFMFNKKTVVNALEKIPYIQEARLMRLFPDKILINIKERKPIGIFYVNNSFTYVDSQEIVVDNSSNIYDSDIPIITIADGSIQSTQAGETISIEPQWIKKNVFGILNELDETEISKYISEINVTDDNLFYIYTKGGSILKINNSDTLHDKIDFVITYLEENDDRMIIDLTHGGNPTYIPRENEER